MLYNITDPRERMMQYQQGAVNAQSQLTKMPTRQVTEPQKTFGGALTSAVGGGYAGQQVGRGIAELQAADKTAGVAGVTTPPPGSVTGEAGLGYSANPIDSTGASYASTRIPAAPPTATPAGAGASPVAGEAAGTPAIQASEPAAAAALSPSAPVAATGGSVGGTSSAAAVAPVEAGAVLGTTAPAAASTAAGTGGAMTAGGAAGSTAGSAAGSAAAEASTVAGAELAGNIGATSAGAPGMAGAGESAAAGSVLGPYGMIAGAALGILAYFLS